MSDKQRAHEAVSRLYGACGSVDVGGYEKKAHAAIDKIPERGHAITAKSLAEAWGKYRAAFGEVPHGTETQMAALLEFVPCCQPEAPEEEIVWPEGPPPTHVKGRLGKTYNRPEFHAEDEAPAVPDAPPEPLPEEVEALADFLDDVLEREMEKPYGGSGAAHKTYAKMERARLVLADRKRAVAEVEHQRDRLEETVGHLEHHRDTLLRERDARLKAVEEAALYADEAVSLMYHGDKDRRSPRQREQHAHDAIAAIVSAARGESQ